MAKRKIDFTGPSVEDLGLALNNSTSENTITEVGNSIIGITDNTNIKSKRVKSAAPVVKNNNISQTGIFSIGNAIISNSEKGNAVISNSTNGNTKRTYNTVQFKLIRDYLYAALGNNDRAEIKLSVMGEELSINPKTLYKHLKTLRETEFILKKHQYCTEIRRR